MILLDPLRTRLMPILEVCPLQAGPLYTSYKDLSLSVEWCDLRAIILPGTGWAIILGHKNRDDPLRAVLPLPLHTTSLRPSILKQIFASLAELPLEAIPDPDPVLVPSISEVQREMSRRKDHDRIHDAEQEQDEEAYERKDGAEDKVGMLDRGTLYLAIVTTDSTVVYYKLSKGIKKPADIPDE